MAYPDFHSLSPQRTSSSSQAWTFTFLHSHNPSLFCPYALVFPVPCPKELYLYSLSTHILTLNSLNTNVLKCALIQFTYTSTSNTLSTSVLLDEISPFTILWYDDGCELSISRPSLTHFQNHLDKLPGTSSKCLISTQIFPHQPFSSAVSPILVFGTDSDIHVRIWKICLDVFTLPKFSYFID